MKIALTSENGKIFQHFGHTETFLVYQIENGKVVDKKEVSANGKGHGALSVLLNELKVNVLICGGIGGGAQSALAEMGIKLYGGVSGSCDEAVENYLSGKLDYNPNVKCEHHDHEHGSEKHTCGDHGCGKGSCSR